MASFCRHTPATWRKDKFSETKKGGSVICSDMFYFQNFIDGEKVNTKRRKGVISAQSIRIR